MDNPHIINIIAIQHYILVVALMIISYAFNVCFKERVLHDDDDNDDDA